MAIHTPSCPLTFVFQLKGTSRLHIQGSIRKPIRMLNPAFISALYTVLPSTPNG